MSGEELFAIGFLSLIWGPIFLSAYFEFREQGPPRWW